VYWLRRTALGAAMTSDMTALQSRLAGDRGLLVIERLSLLAKFDAVFCYPNANDNSA
jgi:hypothetical protein